MAARDYVSHRLHSLIGVIPVGLFLVVHLTVNFQATKGAGAFNQAAAFMEHLPYLLFLEVFLIYLPLLFHAVFGVYLAFTSTYTVNQYGFLRNWYYAIQRFTGLFLVIFLAWHIWETRIAMALGTPLNYDLMATILSNHALFIFYVIGVLSAVFHFSNGVWAFCVHWGILVSPKSQKIGTYAVLILFLLLGFVGIRALFAFV
ncbi:succinate dehydrogenase cytochrome b558 subunit [Sporolactobacillus spathodeae]|uniref:Succinate dehydrogenase / fumarate reductase cytochrome b subunit n=1 Tax=Sporolactobacillus spathodeae TaxID=1465502 RepID=A0ABS2Q8B8_9BACL|nr:succinate dehydrogenase cytochrome b558 subunit [Sporolactobacillus spathodeae]MBM7658023.1 succinate dehydrogenase / fumarate reductase cytochrome b subunit [Sporolactobacillus spathodeae]